MTLSVVTTDLAGSYRLGKPLTCEPIVQAPFAYTSQLPLISQWPTWYADTTRDAAQLTINLDCAQEIITDVLWRDGLPEALTDLVDGAYQDAAADPYIDFRRDVDLNVTGNAAYLTQTSGLLTSPTPGLHIRPGAAAVTSAATPRGRIGLREYGLPINIELYYTCNADRTGLTEWNGYTHYAHSLGPDYGTIGVPYLGIVPASEFIQRHVCGILKQSASAATCTTSDIICGTLYAGTIAGGTIYSCVNGTVRASYPITGPLQSIYVTLKVGKFCNASELGGYANSFDAIEVNANGSFLGSVVPASLPHRGLDTFLTKWVNYLDRITGLGAGVNTNRTLLMYWPSLYTNPGIPV